MGVVALKSHSKKGSEPIVISPESIPPPKPLKNVLIAVTALFDSISDIPVKESP